MYQKMKSEHQKEHFRWTDGRTGLPVGTDRWWRALTLLPRELDKNKLFHFEAMCRGRNSRICNCIRGVFFCPLSVLFRVVQPGGAPWPEFEEYSELFCKDWCDHGIRQVGRNSLPVILVTIGPDLSEGSATSSHGNSVLPLGQRRDLWSIVLSLLLLFLLLFLCWACLKFS